jgi:HSP20 family protein
MTLVKFKNGQGLGSFPAMESALSLPSFFNDTLERLWTHEDIDWMPAVNIRERAEDFIIDLAVPGMDKKDFNVEVDNGVLTVSGERKEEVEDNEKLTRREFHYGAFRRTFSLPASANADAINAAYKDGVLSLTVAKKDEAKLKPKKQISIG